MVSSGTRITAESLPEQPAGKEVRLIGEVVSFDEKEAVISSGDAKFKVLKPNKDNYANTRYVEIFGKVSDPADTLPSVEEIKSIPVGDKFNISLYQRAIKLSTGKFSHLFEPAKRSETMDVEE
eukprot:CAMPEP_0197525696 /NCGR_PEP_ID=MMETSP1318-20131121/13936_1 /TAXON_ID=552666 /ORGANISM="Partenskyella glossopodia, Strain RCC365" /LENGTH=122 /DNA_ID=CAMNT_0043079381 /DNA_START=6 /DNA_END=374 /DNA_ORIENTATION=-